MGPLERANLTLTLSSSSDRSFLGTQQSKYLPLLIRRRKQIQFAKRYVFWYLEFRTMDRVQKASNSEYYTPLSDIFKFYIAINFV
jgi:hypothetical protein